MSSAFDNLIGQGKDPLAEQQRKFEHRCVKLVLNQLGMQLTKMHLDIKLREEFGGGLYTFPMFYEEAPPGFPMRLGADQLKGYTLENGRELPRDYQLHRDRKSTFPCLLRNFPDTTPARAFTEFVESLPPYAKDRPVGLVVPRRGFQNGILVHNDSSEEYRLLGTAAMEYRGDDGSRILIQPFRDLVRAWKESRVGEDQ